MTGCECAECRPAAARHTLTSAARARADAKVAEVVTRFEHIELGQHARDRVAEREDIELGYLDLGGENA